VKNIEIVESFEAKSHVNKSLPYGRFVKMSVVLLMGDYLLVEITIVEKLHDNTA